MRYASAQALRTALETRLLTTSQQSGVALDRLRRRVLFERIVARLQLAEPGRWVLKGGMALEVRLRDSARVTKDIDVGLRDIVTDAEDLHDRLIQALAGDPHEDGFAFQVTAPVALREDGAGHLTWRMSVAASLAGKPFGGIKLDVSPREHELYATERVALPNALDFAGVPATEVEIIDVHRHAAEKFHAMTRDFGDRENSRVRDLLDLVILTEHDLLAPTILVGAVRTVWAERNQTAPPRTLPAFPESWPTRYAQLASEYDVDATSFTRATDCVQDLWIKMFPPDVE